MPLRKAVFLDRDGVLNRERGEHTWRMQDFEVLPGVPYTLSHQLVPILREYRRASATAIDASLKPLMQRHLREMSEDLRAAGFGVEFWEGSGA